MNKHTPGPWNFYTPGGTAASNPNGAAFLIGPTRLYMDKSCGFLDSDARLIAAAPDLLEALIPFLDFADRDSDLNGEILPDTIIESARKAIAKAIGES